MIQLQQENLYQNNPQGQVGHLGISCVGEGGKEAHGLQPPPLRCVSNHWTL